jgi:hypothetical protein
MKAAAAKEPIPPPNRYALDKLLISTDSLQCLVYVEA